MNTVRVNLSECEFKQRQESGGAIKNRDLIIDGPASTWFRVTSGIVHKKLGFQVSLDGNLGYSFLASKTKDG